MELGIHKLRNYLLVLKILAASTNASKGKVFFFL